MSRIKILFFAADPLSAPAYGADRLMLDEDVRRIREKVRSAEHRDSLDFDFRLAARTDDLVQALTEVCPQVVHFSGHGGKEGLVLVSADGRHPRRVDAEGLAELFRAFRGDIRLVVLNACLSLLQARAIADVVGCAIGTRESIPDEAAITFGASFYRAIASGSSVQAAFDRANAAMGLEHPEARGCTELVVRRDVDASALVLVSPDEAALPPVDDLSRPAASPRPIGAGKGMKWAISAALAITLSGGAALAASRQPPETPINSLMAPAGASGPEADLAAGRTFYEAGNYDAAFPLFKRAAEAENVEAMGFLAIAYLKGQGTPRQPQTGTVWLDRAAKKLRDPRAMNALGAAYEEGDGVDQSYRLAMHWYENAAEEGGWAPAMANIGDMFRHGLGRRRDYATAIAWYQKASDAGFEDALVDMGTMHEEGLLGRRDVETARRLYRDAADRGSARGMVEMGRIHQDGVDVPRDYAAAWTWYQKAVEARSAEAMNNMGVLYYNGWGVRQDRDEAVRWFRRAAEAGSAVAAGNLAAM